MINYICGKYIGLVGNQLIIENNGIGYDMLIPISNVRNLPDINSDIKVYTYMIVKEDDISLYGFLNEDDRNVFLLLITVNGVGPKGALSIISTLGFTDTIKAIKTADAKKISSIQGIGTKTASKIVIELSDKIKKLVLSDSIDTTKINNEEDERIKNVKNEVIEALVVLGYQKKSATDLVNKFEYDKNITSDELLKLILKK